MFQNHCPIEKPCNSLCEVLLVKIDDVPAKFKIQKYGISIAHIPDKDINVALQSAVPKWTDYWGHQARH